MKYIILTTLMGLTPLFLSLLNKQANAQNKENSKEFKMPTIYLYMGFVMLFIAALILIIGPEPTINQSLSNCSPIQWYLFTLCLVFGLYIFLVYSMHKIVLQDSGFLLVSPFGRKTKFKFSEIQNLDLNLFTYFITIKSTHGKKGYIYFHLRGLIRILRQIRKESHVDIVEIERVLKV
jgi:hypothetical protein